MWLAILVAFNLKNTKQKQHLPVTEDLFLSFLKYWLGLKYDDRMYLILES